MSIPFVSTPSGYLIHNLEHLLAATKEPILKVNLCQCLRRIYAIVPPLIGSVIHWIKHVPKQECPAKYKEEAIPYVIMLSKKKRIRWKLCFQ